MTPFSIVKPFKLNEMTDSHTIAGGGRSLYNTFFIWVMNKDSYDALPDDLKAVIDANSGIETSAWAGRAMDLGDEIGQKAAIQSGNIMHTMDDVTMTTLLAIGRDLTSAWTEEMTEKGLDGAGMVAHAQALVAKYSSK